jgi:hypothetical protein
MKKEGAIGTTALLAIAAVVGFSVYPGGPTRGGPDTGSAAAKSKSGGSTHKPKPPSKNATWCDDLTGRLGIFLEIKDPDDITRAPACYETKEDPKHPPVQDPDVLKATANLKFVIALLPDPLHTHLPVLFDQFTGAIQEAGQDEHYDFDSSWLPWQDEEPDYALLDDRQNADHLKEMREQQPGVILFRKAPLIHGAPSIGDMLPEYRQGLVVLVVAEDATHGIHREQFRNALDWIYALAPQARERPGAVTILGPTFSGSLPSLAQLLTEQDILQVWNLQSSGQAGQSPCSQFAIYSGAVSDKLAAEWFRAQFLECPAKDSGKNPSPQVVFHSFVADDETELNRFCEYLSREQWKRFIRERVVVISEDETAYGSLPPSTPPAQQERCASKFMRIFYPRDISALRGAYQTKSIFDSGIPSQPSDAQRRNLPTDLADPAGEVHDSIKTYGGNQTPLVQEAFLLQMVAALRDFHARYLILRSSNSLDQVFLTNFLRRTYPDGRIVIVGSDLLFSRERGATGLSGTMTLSTYPLSAPARRWMDYATRPSFDRVFSSDQSEGTYIALRLLLSGSSRPSESQQFGECHAIPLDDRKIFLPKVTCSSPAALPDYALPYWLNSNYCPDTAINEPCEYSGPATWLSAVGQNKLWPLAVLYQDAAQGIDTTRTESVLVKLFGDPAIALASADSDLGRRPEMPLVMKIFWLILVAFAAFHAWCCWFGSFTAKPSFRAQFAGTSVGHEALVFVSTCFVAFLALMSAFCCASFSIRAYALVYPWFGLICGAAVCGLMLLSTIGASRCGHRISRDSLTAAYGGPDSSPRSAKRHAQNDHYWRKNRRQYMFLFVVAITLFTLLFILPMEWVLRPANHVLGSWRGMNLLSGISWLVPLLAMLAGFYAAVWFSLHGMALFGMDRSLLPLSYQLRISGEQEFDKDGHSKVGMLSMFGRGTAQTMVEKLCRTWNDKVIRLTGLLAVVFLLIAFGTASGFPIRSLGSHNYSLVVFIWLDLCCSLLLAEAWRLFAIWENLRILLVFLDRLPLRRTLASLHGFSWGSVWKMGGNVLELRYKLISRQIECMNHTINTIEKAFSKDLDPATALAAQECRVSLGLVNNSVQTFAAWYTANLKNADAGNLKSFRRVQQELAKTSGLILAHLLVPYWRKEGISLTQLSAKPDKSDEPQETPPLAKELYIRNAEEFVCLNYLAFVQNVLGRIRTITITIVVLFLAAAVAISSYPFDPRQALSAVLVVLLLAIGIVIVHVYAGMHRDATLSHVTNTKPGELGPEFWFKLVGFGFAPVIGLLARIFPSITDFLFSWLQPSISSLK